MANMNNEASDLLESLVDLYSLHTVTATLSAIASAKANHIRANWQDEDLASSWDSAAKELDRASEHCPAF